MGLELKHVAPYLPYNLKFTTQSGKIVDCEFGAYGFVLIKKQSNMLGDKRMSLSWSTMTRNYKPILRPLSDFYKKITHNSKTFIPIIELANINFPRHDWCVVDKYQYIKTKKGGYSFEWDYGYNCWLFDGSSQMDQTALHYKMLEWHFDVFGLIEKGLAIDINTLNQ